MFFTLGNIKRVPVLFSSVFTKLIEATYVNSNFYSFDGRIIVATNLSPLGNKRLLLETTNKALSSSWTLWSVLGLVWNENWLKSGDQFVINWWFNSLLKVIFRSDLLLTWDDTIPLHPWTPPPRVRLCCLLISVIIIILVIIIITNTIPSPFQFPFPIVTSSTYSSWTEQLPWQHWQLIRSSSSTWHSSWT